MTRVPILALVFFFAACSGAEDPCPSSLREGGECEIEDLICPFPGGQCTGNSATACVCQNQPGGFYWHCEIKTCRCTCFCDKVAVNSCESLGCTQPSDPCPDEGRAAEICTLLCSDAGTPDSRLPDIGAADTGTDGPPADAPGDQSVDAPADQGSMEDLTLDALPDAPLDAGAAG